MPKELRNHSRWILKVHASQASPTTSPQHAATVSPTAVPGKESLLFLCLTGLILRSSLSAATAYQIFKEPRCLIPVRLVGAEPGLEPHPYSIGASYLFRPYFASELLPYGNAIFHLSYRIAGSTIRYEL